MTSALLGARAAPWCAITMYKQQAAAGIGPDRTGGGNTGALRVVPFSCACAASGAASAAARLQRACGSAFDHERATCHHLRAMVTHAGFTPLAPVALQRLRAGGSAAAAQLQCRARSVRFRVRCRTRCCAAGDYDAALAREAAAAVSAYREREVAERAARVALASKARLRAEQQLRAARRAEEEARRTAEAASRELADPRRSWAARAASASAADALEQREWALRLEAEAAKAEAQLNDDVLD